MTIPIRVDLKIKYNCGCGYHTTSGHAADAHVARTGHTMEVTGWVVPTFAPTPKFMQDIG